MVEIFPRIRLVSAPEVDAEVRLDLNVEDEVRPDAEGWSFGTPELEGEPGSMGVEFGFRTLTMSLRVWGSQAEAAAFVAKLARELLRRSNWLLYQFSESMPPIWFRTFQTSPGEIDLTAADAMDYDGDDSWLVSVSLVAEPFAHGERITLGPYTINNSPRAASNPLHVVLPEIVGDAPTPLRVRARVSDEAQRQGATSLLAATPAAPVSAVDGALGADTTKSGSEIETTFDSEPGMARRVTFDGPSVPQGRYQVFARMLRTSTAEVRAQLTDLGSPARVVSEVALPLTGIQYRYVNLGTIDIPIGNRDGDESGQTAPARFGLSLARTSGSGSAFLAGMLLVPVDLGGERGTVAQVGHGTSAETVDATVIDAGAESVRLFDASGAAVPLTADPQVVGGFPSATPGVSNVLTYMPTFRPAGSVADHAATTTEVTVSYAPRYLYLAGY